MWQRVKQATPRWLALLALGAVALGSYAIAPAVGGPGNLTTKKAKRLFYTKKRTHALFYTKNQSNARYYTRSVANARFVPQQSGEHSVTLDPWDWDGPAPDPQPGFVRFTGPGADVELDLHDGSLPSQFAGKALRLSAVEICYELIDATIDNVLVRRSGPIGNDPITTPITFVDDSTNRTVDECRRVGTPPPPPAPPGGAAMLDIELTVDFAGGAGRIDIGRTTAIFVP